MVQASGHYGEYFPSSEESDNFFCGLRSREDELRAQISIHKTLDNHGSLVVNAPMEQPRPQPDGIAHEFKLRPHTPNELCKNNVYRNSIGIETIRTRTEYDIELNIF
jgi:hypothetical protein